MTGFDAFFKKEYACTCCSTKAHRKQSNTDYIWLVCENCGYLYYLPPVNKTYESYYLGDTKLKLNEDEINNLIEIALSIWDKKWFNELCEMKKIVNGWAITPISSFLIEKEKNKNETL